MAQKNEKATRIEIIWDHDHGTACEGFYVRRWYADGHDEDENLGDSGFGLTDTDEDIITGVLYSDESEIPTTVKR